MTTLMFEIEEKSPGFISAEIFLFLAFITFYAHTVFSGNRTSKNVTIETFVFLFFPLLVFFLGWIDWIKWINPIIVTYSALLASVLLKHSEDTNKTSKEKLFNALVTVVLFALSLVCIRNDGNTQLDDSERVQILLVGIAFLIIFFWIIITIRKRQESLKKMNNW